MPEGQESHKAPETIPQQVMREFLDQLLAQEVAPEVIGRLRVALLESPDLSEIALRTALFAPSEKI